MDKYRVRITEACRYAPEGQEATTLEVGEIVEAMPAADAYNIVSAGRGVFENAAPKRVKAPA